MPYSQDTQYFINSQNGNMIAGNQTVMPVIPNAPYTPNKQQETQNMKLTNQSGNIQQQNGAPMNANGKISTHIAKKEPFEDFKMIKNQQGNYPPPNGTTWNQMAKAGVLPECIYCDKRFIDAGQIKRHLRKHCWIRP